MAIQLLHVPLLTVDGWRVSGGVKRMPTFQNITGGADNRGSSGERECGGILAQAWEKGNSVRIRGLLSLWIGTLWDGAQRKGFRMTKRYCSECNSCLFCLPALLRLPHTIYLPDYPIGSARIRSRYGKGGVRKET